MHARTPRRWTAGALALGVIIGLVAGTGARAAAPLPGSYAAGAHPSKATATVTKTTAGRLVVKVAFTPRSCASAGRRAQMPRPVGISRAGRFSYRGRLRGAGGTATITGRFTSGAALRVTIRHRQGRCTWRAALTVVRRLPAGGGAASCQAPQVQAWRTTAGALYPVYSRPPGARAVCWPEVTGYRGTWRAGSFFSGTDDTDTVLYTSSSVHETWDMGLSARFTLEDAFVGPRQGSARYSATLTGGASVNRTQIGLHSSGHTTTCITAGQAQVGGGPADLTVAVTGTAATYTLNTGADATIPVQETCTNTEAGETQVVNGLDSPDGPLLELGTPVPAASLQALRGRRELDLGQETVGPVLSAPVAGWIQWELTAR